MIYMLVESRAPTNIAVVKYWGKNPEWEKYNLPTKSSASFTADGLFTKTALEAKKGAGKIAFTLNGRKILPSFHEFEYLNTTFGKLFELFPASKGYDYAIESENNFPTAAGYASSASGFAALAKCLSGAFRSLEPELYKKHFSDDKKLSTVARLGSGSAARSIPSEGGFVVWHRGLDPQSSPSISSASGAEKEKILLSSYADTVFPSGYWPDFRILYCKIEAGEKKVLSRFGMKSTAQTCPLYWKWVDYEEQELLPQMVEAVRARDFGSFARLTMECSNGLHAMMLYSTPRISYLSDASHKVIDSVLELNAGKPKAAYTFDAGTNAVVFTTAKHEKEVAGALAKIVGDGNVTATKPGAGPSITRVEE